ncbi:uncharacterized protein LOC132641680 isoform X2 [Lycium barbarum]|uniref:uncharacterized protein LOC132641680 isoform X2 n=1 Tax=Lycium barbarum TaxID=112863 RepID=UPI00293EB51F|nr:uncharacterized protein LOC132641680 isoform X2 [Lycium barbarum]
MERESSAAFNPGLVKPSNIKEFTEAVIRASVNVRTWGAYAISKGIRTLKETTPDGVATKGRGPSKKRVVKKRLTLSSDDDSTLEKIRSLTSKRSNADFKDPKAVGKPAAMNAVLAQEVKIFKAERNSSVAKLDRAKGEIVELRAEERNFQK